jgi:homoserine O-acetyltransferase
MANHQTYQHPEPFLLESGEAIHQLRIAYHTYGKLDATTSKVVWVCHALTANSDVSDWWNGIFGKGEYFDNDEYFVVCANILGSCYGTTGPLDNHESGKPYLRDFPLVTTRDMARAHEVLKEHLGINRIHLLIGSSLGGQQAQEFAISLKNNLEHLILIATNARHSPFGIAFNEAQRLALLADESFEKQEPNGGQKGLAAARSIAMLSYRSYAGYQLTQQEDSAEKTDGFKAASYQQYQGQKLVKRFNAYSYWSLSKSMDSHHVGRGRTSIEAALGLIKARTLVVGISSDLLFPTTEQEFLKNHIPGATLQIMHSDFGHDGFLADAPVLKNLIVEFIKNK